MKQKAIIKLVVSWSLFIVICVGIVLYVKNNSNSSKSTGTTSAETTTQGSTITTAEITTEETIPENLLIKDSNPEIHKLIDDYLNALVTCDMKTLKTLDLNTEAYNKDVEFKRAAEFVEAYKNIECYTKNGLEDGTYIAYVVLDTKIVNIDTLAPGIFKYYIVTDKDGKFKINTSSDLEVEVDNYIKSIGTDEDVLELVGTINKKCEDALTKDPDLKKFIGDI